MADMEALKEQLMSMKRNGKGFLCVGTDDPEEAAQIMKLAAELSQEEKKEQYEEEDYEEEDEDEERTEPKKAEYIFDLNGRIYSDDGIAELVAENYEDLAVEVYKNDLKGFLMDLRTEEIDYLKDRVLRKLDTASTGHKVFGIEKKTVWKSSWVE